MKINKKVAALTLTALSGAAIIPWVLSSRSAMNLTTGGLTMRSHPQSPCAFSKGEEVGFDVLVETKGTVRGDALGAKGANVPLEQSVALEFHMRVLSTDGQAGAVLLARAADVAPTALAETLRAPFLLRVSPGCELTGFARHGTTTSERGRAIQALAYELNLAYAPIGESVRVEGDNSAGHYRASYRGEAQGTSVVLEQTTRTYTTIWTDQRKTATPSTSTVSAVFGDGPWFEQLTRREQLTGVGPNDTDTHIEVSRIETTSSALDGVDLDPAQYIWENLLPRVHFPRSSRPVTKRDLAARAAVRDQPVEEAIVAHITRSQTLDNFAEIWPPLTTYLEAHPEQTENVVNALRTGAVPPEGRAAGWVAVGQARTTEARDALLKVMRDKAAASVNRTRAMFALVDRDDVSAPLVSELGAYALDISSAPTENERFFAREGALAMGMMASLHEERDPEMHAVAVAQVPKLLASQKSADGLHPVFGAVANLGDAKTLALVEPYTRSENPKIREGAAQSFRRMRALDFSPMLASWLARETDLGVRRELYTTLSKQMHDRREVPAHEVSDQAIRDLAAHPAVITRRALIKVLGVAAPSYEPARQALMVQAKKETELRSGLYSVITSYLGADALLAGLSTQGAAP